MEATVVDEQVAAPFGQTVAAVLQFELAKTKPVLQVKATEFEVQVATLDPHYEHAPDDKKYPVLQVKAAVFEVQVATLFPHYEHAPADKNQLLLQVKATVFEVQVAAWVPH